MKITRVGENCLIKRGTWLLFYEKRPFCIAFPNIQQKIIKLYLSFISSPYFFLYSVKKKTNFSTINFVSHSFYYFLAFHLFIPSIFISFFNSSVFMLSFFLSFLLFFLFISFFFFCLTFFLYCVLCFFTLFKFFLSFFFFFCFLLFAFICQYGFFLFLSYSLTLPFNIVCILSFFLSFFLSFINSFSPSYFTYFCLFVLFFCFVFPFVSLFLFLLSLFRFLLFPSFYFVLLV